MYGSGRFPRLSSGRRHVAFVIITALVLVTLYIYIERERGLVLRRAQGTPLLTSSRRYVDDTPLLHSKNAQSDLAMIDGVAINICQNTSKILQFSCQLPKGHRLRTALVDVNCSNFSNPILDDSTKILGTTLLLEFGMAHFPHIAQNLLFALGSAYDMGLKIDQMVLHGPAIVSSGHGAGWVRDLVNLTNVDLMNDSRDSRHIQNLFGIDGTSSAQCRNHSKMVVFDRLLMRTKTQPIWFPSRESCQWLRSLVAKTSQAGRHDGNQSEGFKEKLAIFIDRKGSRAMEGLQTLAELLKVRKFRIESYSFEGTRLIDQINVMAKEASFFLMAHGAAQTNVMFMNSKSIMIEVFPYNYVPSYDWYTGLADSCGLNSVPFMNSNSSGFEKRCKNHANASISECMGQFSCRACARSVPIHLDVRSLLALILHLT